MSCVWLIQPRDPLIFRDGKPFNATPGAQAKSLPFPYPSTLAGAIRTREGMAKNGHFDSQQIERLLQLNVRGPVLAALDKAGEVEAWLFPAPADCLVIQAGEDAKQGKRLWVRPVELPVGTMTDLERLSVVSPHPAVKQKSHKAAPHFWQWETLQTWLKHPSNDTDAVNLADIGMAGLTSESRMHVRIDAETGTADEGFLFQTNGLEFSSAPQDSNRKALSQLRQYALAVATDATFARGIDFLGGERRVVQWRPSDKSLPTCPPEIRKAIITQKHCRLVLATPALFAQGFLPEWVCQQIPELTVKIVAAAVGRYQAVSGWDVKENMQKASRRLAPAGSVYFLSLEGDARAIERFIDAVWMQSVSDDAQDRRDGFGLALLGAWDGEIEPLEVKK